jgi:hypothetical protein
MKIETKIPTSTRGAQLRSQAQEKLDAAGGEKIAAKGARSVSEAEKARYADGMEQRSALLAEAKQLRADAAEKLKGAVGPRGMFGLENVARGFATLMNKLAGKSFVTVESLKADPDATQTAARMEKLAAQKEQQAHGLFETAQKSWVASTAALAKAEGHEKTAAAHAEAAAALMKKAKRTDQLTHMAHTAGAAAAAAASSTFSSAAGAAAFAAKAGFEALSAAAKDVAKREGKALVEEAKREIGKIGDEAVSRARGDLRGLLQLGVDFLKAAVDAFFDKVEGKGEPKAPEKAPEKAQSKASRARPKKPAAEPPSTEKVRETVAKAAPHVPQDAKPKLLELGFTPGKVSFDGARAPREPIVLRGPRIDEPPKGEKKISESFLAARWAAEAAGIDWVGKGAGELKKLIETTKGGLKLSHGASPFEAKKRLAERMGLPTASDAIHAMTIDDVRQMFAQREAVGLPRLTSKVDLHKALDAAGLKRDAGLDELAMFGMAKGQQELASASQALKVDLQSADKKAAFDKAATALDRSKRVMLDVLHAMPAADRHVLALDACDAVEAGHGKPGATTKLGFALEALGKNGAFSSHVKGALGLDDAQWRAALEGAAKASEWISLGELAAPSAVLAYPGPLTDAQRRDVIAPLSRAGAFMAGELGLVDAAGLAALEGHMVFTGAEPASAQLLGLSRQLLALSERRDFRTKEQLSKTEILDEIVFNCGWLWKTGRDGKEIRKDPPSLNEKLIERFDLVIDEALKSLR